MCVWVKEDLVALAIHRAERAMLVTSRAIIAVSTSGKLLSTTLHMPPRLPSTLNQLQIPCSPEKNTSPAVRTVEPRRLGLFGTSLWLI